MKFIIRMKGGSGSGNFGHAGRKGQLGGSAPAGGGGGTSGGFGNWETSETSGHGAIYTNRSESPNRYSVISVHGSGAVSMTIETQTESRSLHPESLETAKKIGEHFRLSTKSPALYKPPISKKRYNEIDSYSKRLKGMTKDEFNSEYERKNPPMFNIQVVGENRHRRVMLATYPESDIEAWEGKNIL